MAIHIQIKWQSIYKTNGNPDIKQMAIQIQSKWQSRYKTNGNVEYVYTLKTKAIS